MNTGDIVSGVYSRLGVANLPSTLTATDIINLANDRILDINNRAGLSISGDNIPNTILSPLKDLVTADVMAHTLGFDIDTEIGIGNIKLAYKDQFNAESKQMDYFLEKGNKGLDMAVGRKIFSVTTIKVV